MHYALNVPGFEQQLLEIDTQGWFALPTLRVNGQPVIQGLKQTQALLTRDDGTEVAVRLGSGLFDGAPYLLVGKDRIRPAAPLRWYEYAAGALPLLLLPGGTAGVALATVAMLVNGRLLRSGLPAVRRYLAMAATLLVAVWALLLLALLTEGSISLNVRLAQ
jgi:hypothetical protein